MVPMKQGQLGFPSSVFRWSKWVAPGESTAMHLIGAFGGRRFGPSQKKRFLASGLDLEGVWEYSRHRAEHCDKLIFGCGNLSLEEISRGIAQLKKVLDS
ncbi:hypothetical protein ACFL5O_11195 [Myxococcota bacterium]